MNYFSTLEYESKETDIITEEYIYQLYEGLDISKFKTIFKKSFGEFKTHFKFVTTFGLVMPIMFPLVENLIKNSSFVVDLNPQNIVFATVATLSMIIGEKKSSIQSFKQKLISQDKKWEVVLDSLVNTFKSIKELFRNVAKLTGKVIKTWWDMLSFTMLVVPFVKVLTEVMVKQNWSIDNWDSLLATFVAGIFTIGGKNVLQMVTYTLKKKHAKIKWVEPVGVAGDKNVPATT